MNESAGPRFVVALAASAGGIPALQKILSGLSPDSSAAILVVLHLSPNRESHLARVLGRSTRLPTLPAQDGDQLRAGKVYVATPDHHLTIGENATARLTSAPKVDFTRPSADPLFTSAAERFGPRSILVVLSGCGRNGAACLPRAKELGARTIAQDEATSAFFSMPKAAIETGAVDEILPVGAIANRLRELTEMNVSDVASACGRP